MGPSPTGGEQSSRAASPSERVRAADDAADVARALEDSDVDLVDVIRISEINSEFRKSRNDTNNDGSNSVACNLTEFGGTYHDIDSYDMLKIRTLDDGIFVEPFDGESRAGD
jgi:hypothetical protein